MGNVITIVSGLPRSGTSMMMKMLEAGGLEALTDNIREADEDNPKGYYEFERVKKIKEDKLWLDDVKGRVVKMISSLLYDLPADRRYKVIFMRRKMEEILASQKVMLERRGTQDHVNDADMSKFFNHHLEGIMKWLKEQENFDVLYVNYNEVVDTPAECAKKVNEFLGNALDYEKMSHVVDNNLYKQRK